MTFKYDEFIKDFGITDECIRMDLCGYSVDEFDLKNHPSDIMIYQDSVELYEKDGLPNIEILIHNTAQIDFEKYINTKYYIKQYGDVGKSDYINYSDAFIATWYYGDSFIRFRVGDLYEEINLKENEYGRHVCDFDALRNRIKKKCSPELYKEKIEPWIKVKEDIQNRKLKKIKKQYDNISNISLIEFYSYKIKRVYREDNGRQLQISLTDSQKVQSKLLDEIMNNKDKYIHFENDISDFFVTPQFLFSKMFQKEKKVNDIKKKLSKVSLNKIYDAADKYFEDENEAATWKLTYKMLLDT